MPALLFVQTRLGFLEVYPGDKPAHGPRPRIHVFEPLTVRALTIPALPVNRPMRFPLTRWPTSRHSLRFTRVNQTDVELSTARWYGWRPVQRFCDDALTYLGLDRVGDAVFLSLTMEGRL